MGLYKYTLIQFAITSFAWLMFVGLGTAFQLGVAILCTCLLVWSLVHATHHS